MAGLPVKAAYWIAPESSTFPASRINPYLFNHLFCGFAIVNPATYEVELPSPTDPFTTFSSIVRNVKTILSIGGKNSQLQTFASMVSKKEYRKNFIDSSIKLARAYGFVGLDLFWMYPRNQTEMNNLGDLLIEWKKAIAEDQKSSGKAPLLLTAAVYFSPKIDTSASTYPTKAMKTNLDWVNVIAYDLTDPSRSGDNTAAPAWLYSSPGKPCVDNGIKEWLADGKVVLGLPFYGHAWILADPNRPEIGVPADGPYDGYNQFKTYAEIKNLLEQGFEHRYNRTYVTDYCWQGRPWVAYDGPESIKRKVSYAKEQELLGYFGFTVGWDSHDAELARTASETLG